MAVATRTAQAALRTEKLNRTASPVSRRYRKRRSRMWTFAAIGAIMVVCSLVHIGFYAHATYYGYKKAELAGKIRQVDMQTQALKAEIQTLSSPDRLAAAAVAAGMVPSTKYVYITNTDKVKLAKAD